MRLVLLICAAAVTLAGCSSGQDSEASASPTSTSTSERTTDPEPSARPDDWPPRLPPAVPTTGEHAWRATWTPEPDAEEQFLSGLLEGASASWGEGYVPANAEKLVRFGYQICADYYRGVPGGDEYEHVIAQLVEDEGFRPTLTDGGSYGDVRTATAAGAALEVTMAANRHFCMNIDPYGEY